MMRLLIYKYEPFWQEVSVKSLILRWPLRPMGLLSLDSNAFSLLYAKFELIFFFKPPKFKKLMIISRCYTNLTREWNRKMSEWYELQSLGQWCRGCVLLSKWWGRLCEPCFLPLTLYSWGSVLNYPVFLSSNWFQSLPPVNHDIYGFHFCQISKICELSETSLAHKKVTSYQYCLEWLFSARLFVWTCQNGCPFSVVTVRGRIVCWMFWTSQCCSIPSLLGPL